MFSEKFIKNIGPKTTFILGAFPVTQQALGLTLAVLGIADTVVNVAKLAFLKIKEAFEKRNPKLNSQAINDLYEDIKAAKYGVEEGRATIVFGILMMIPVVASVLFGMEWYRR